MAPRATVTAFSDLRLCIRRGLFSLVDVVGRVLVAWGVPLSLPLVAAPCPPTVAPWIAAGDGQSAQAARFAAHRPPGRAGWSGEGPCPASTRSARRSGRQRRVRSAIHGRQRTAAERTGATSSRSRAGTGRGDSNERCRRGR